MLTEESIDGGAGPAARFEEHRRALFGVAYRMTGSAADAEDLVQDAYVRWARAPHGQVRSQEEYLVAIVTRLAVDHLRSARVRREEYVGPWLPEPLAGAAGPGVPAADARVELAESLQTAFLVVMESLSPAERAALLLREVFGFDYAYLSFVLDRSQDSCRQLVHRARRRAADGRARFAAPPQELREVTERFMEACASGDVQKLLAMLAPDVAFVGDGGGAAHNALRPVLGPANVARLLLALPAKMPPDVSARLEPVNGHPGVVLRCGATPYAVLTLAVAGGLVTSVYVVNNPAKLSRVPAPGSARPDPLEGRHATRPD